MISGDQVSRGKPEPDIFQKVAEHYKKPPENCIVIEDCTNAILAAKDPNMFCIGYYNPSSGIQDLTRADLVIDNFYDKNLWEMFDK